MRALPDRLEQQRRTYRRGTRLRARELARRAVQRAARGHAARHPGADVREIIRETRIRAARRMAVSCALAAAILLPPPSALESVHWTLLCIWTAVFP